jgi:hypothetical protein
VLAGAAALPQAGRAAEGKARKASMTLYTFGDSVLDCGHYNAQGLTPGALIVRNDDRLFPEFRGRELASAGLSATLQHRAEDGATVDGLARQARGLVRDDEGVALVSVGGNDLLRGLAADEGAGLQRFGAALDAFLRALQMHRIVLATVYDPTFGDDARNFLGVPAAVARRNHVRMNELLRELARRHGRLADLHAHFLHGDASWFTQTIEPSLRGASEVRRVCLPLVAGA